MEKKTYESPEIKVVELEVCQVIASSFPGDNVSLDLDSDDDDDLPTLGSDGYFRAD